MQWSMLFFLNSVLFGVGLAMDAFSVSLANGLNEPRMKRARACTIAGVFALFQTVMPLVGWLMIHGLAERFHVVQRLIPWIALGLLAYLGASMLHEGIRAADCGGEKPAVGCMALIGQGIATSIDALSVGLTSASYEWPMALCEALIIGTVTFVICMGGLYLGRKLGTKLAGKASILGGVILIAIGLEIFFTGIF